MRRLLGLLILPALALPASAEPAQRPDAPAAHRARQTWQQHFADANAAHDGHLTANEAKGGFAQVARHFDEIDVDQKGYVTENDVRAWKAMLKAARRLTKPPEDVLRPRAAFQRKRPDAQPLSVSSRQKMTMLNE
jgi:hypothetical protein